MNALQSAAEPFNTALNQNTPVGQELEEIRRGMNYAGTLYDSITRAIARVKEGEQTKTIDQDLDPEGLVASIMADVEGASRQTMGQTEEKKGEERTETDKYPQYDILQSQIDKEKYPQYDILQSQIDKDKYPQYNVKEESDRSDDDGR